MTITGDLQSTSCRPDHRARLCPEPEASVSGCRWLASKAAHVVRRIYEATPTIPNPAYYIVSSPGFVFVLLALAGKGLTAVNASPYTPSSVRPSARSPTTALSSVTMPLAPPPLPPRHTPARQSANSHTDQPQTPDRDRRTKVHVTHTRIDHPPPIENRCVEQYLSYQPPTHSLACPGNMFPTGQTRNFREEHLDCRQAEHTYIRYPDPRDLAAWRTRKDQDPHKVADQMRQFPNPVQRGTLDYPIDHVWTWEQCLLIEDPAHCGTYQVCKTTERTTETGQTVVSRVCKEHTRQCYVDTIMVSRQPCSRGKMDFAVEFLKRDFQQSPYPGHQNYGGVMPKGYELLPGETETITIKRQSLAGESLPVLHIADARNEYTPTLFIDQGTHSLQCRWNGYDKIIFKVTTGQRILSYPPNILSFPDEMAFKSILWAGELDVNDQYDPKGYPRGLRLQTHGLQIFDSVIAATSAHSTAELSVKVELLESSLLWGHWLRSTAYFNRNTIQCADEPERENSESSPICEFRFNEGSPGEMIYYTQLPGVVYPLVQSFCYLAPAGYCSEKTAFFRDDLAPGHQYSFKISTGLNLPFYHAESFSRNSLTITFEANPKIDQRTWHSFFWNTVRHIQYAALCLGVGTAIITRTPQI